jgi:hypothetical protein
MSEQALAHELPAGSAPTRDEYLRTEMNEG